MDDLYDEFGNFIGEAEESEEESQHGINGASAYVYDEEPEEEAEVNDQQLMEIDGGLQSMRCVAFNADPSQRLDLRMP
ncbi:hypothetical protein LTR39_005902 [Cryomyces antarcticus]|nr:hypothetical protein LTR39_005902 [Cryomyces antarcticus]